MTPPDAALVEAQERHRFSLIERIGKAADLMSETPLEGALGDVAYDLLRQAAAQISSDRLRLTVLRQHDDAQVRVAREALRRAAMRLRLTVPLLLNKEQQATTERWAEEARAALTALGDPE